MSEVYHARLYHHNSFPSIKSFACIVAQTPWCVPYLRSLLEHEVVNASFAFQYGFSVQIHTFRLSHISHSHAQFAIWDTPLHLRINGSACRGIVTRCFHHLHCLNPNGKFVSVWPTPSFLQSFSHHNLQNQTGWECYNGKDQTDCQWCKGESHPINSIINGTFVNRSSDQVHYE